MTEEQKPTQLDAGIDDSVFAENKGSPLKKKDDSKLLPYLLGGLILVAGYFFISGGGRSDLQTELTPEQVEVQTAVTDFVESYIAENGSLPDNPAELNLPEEFEIITGDDGSWVVRTADGQLIFSEGALPPFEGGP
ncbi:MAG: hypothetical protein K8S62_14140 [Candidatus Sabulitectum sp.]|nr:hypothetical protein [Candidatus Sabulitectum sp.]